MPRPSSLTTRPSMLIVPAAALARGWTKALEAKNQGDKARTLKLVHQVCRGFVGLTDGPGYCFLDEMLELYPDAKVVLVRRDPERWAKSFDGVFSAASAWYIPVVTAIRPGTRWVKPIARLFQQWAEKLMLELGLQPEEPYWFGPSENPSLLCKNDTDRL